MNSPRQRLRASPPPATGDGTTAYLPYRPPYQWPAMRAFLEARAVPATETVVDGVYRRSLQVVGDDGRPVAGVVAVRHAPERAALQVTLSPSLAPHARPALERIAHLFDVGCDPAAMAAVLGDLATETPGLRLPGAVDIFEIGVRAILGQQVTVAAARTLATRLVARFGARAGGDASLLFPQAAAIAAEEPGRLVTQLGEMGIVRVRGQAIADLARMLAAGELPLAKRPRGAPTRDEAEAAVAALCAIRGIGPWTANYLVMRGLGWSDAFPPGDVAARNALGAATPAAALAIAERWRPWRAYALMHLWRRAAQRPGGRTR